MRSTRFYDLLGRASEQFGLYSSYRPVSLNLHALLKFGQTAPASKSFEFLRNELPVRMTNMLQEVRLLPDRFIESEQITHALRLYEETFTTFLKYRNCTAINATLVSDFTEDLRVISERHIDVISHVASGIESMKQGSGSLSDEEDRWLHYFLDRFYTCRIGIRMLTRQHILLYGSWVGENEDLVGLIAPHCNPVQQVVIAYAHARRMCIAVYGRAPGCKLFAFDRLPNRSKGAGKKPKWEVPSVEVTVDAMGNVDGPFDSLMFPHIQAVNCSELDISGQVYIDFCYIPGHLFHILFELMKNAMRAVVEHRPSESSLPKLQVVVVRAGEDVTIKLSDLGGGMLRQQTDQAFNYSFTTASRLGPFPTKPVDGTDTNLNPTTDPEKAIFSPLAGRGHGLPLSRLYARYLSGDLRLSSVEGHGTSAFLYLKRRPEHAKELIPLFNRTSKSVYQSETTDCDWISRPIGGANRPAPFQPGIG